MKCPSCKSPMSVIPITEIRQDKKFPNRSTLLRTMNRASINKLCHCKYCGKAFYYLSNGKLENAGRFKSKDDALFLKLRDNADKTPADLNELLKLKPGKSTVDDVAEELGSPFAKHMLDTGIVLLYHSNDPSNPHSILIDPLYKVVKLVAIHNDNEAFDLNNLGAAYDEQEFVTRTDGFEFWIYEAHGVAKVTEGFSNEAILYVQFFEKRLDMNRYMEMNCFFEETFMS